MKKINFIISFLIIFLGVFNFFSFDDLNKHILAYNQVTVTASPSEVLINQTVTIKTEAIPECNSSTAICEWRWSGDVSKTTTNNQLMTSFSTAGTKNVSVDVYVKDSKVTNGSAIKVASGSISINVLSSSSNNSTPIPTPIISSSPTPTKTSSPIPSPTTSTKTTTPTCSITPHEAVVYVSPNPANINQTVTIKTEAIPECNSSTAICEWRWSGDVSKTTTNKQDGSWTTSFSTAGTKNIYVEVYVKDSTICDNNWIKVAYGNKTLTINSSSSNGTPTPTPTSTTTPTCSITPHEAVVYVSPNPANINQTVTIKTEAIPECNSSTAICEWRWSGDVSKTTTNKQDGSWTTSFSTAGTKNIYVEVYVKDSTICDNNWIKVAYGNKTLTINSNGNGGSGGGSGGGGGGGYWNVVIGETPTPTPTVYGTSTCVFTHFASALAERTCWINGKNGGSCYLSTSDGFNVNLAILANSYPDDIRINISIHQLNRLIDANTKVGNYQFVGQKIIHVAAEDENCNEIDLENLATLTINYLNNDTTGFDENSFTIVHNPFIPYNWSLITTYRNPNLNSLSIFTAQFGYFGIVGLKPEQKVAGISITKTSLPPAFIAWYNPLCITEPENLSSFYSLATLFDKIKNFDLPWYWISLLFNILLILWLLWMYAGKKLLDKYRVSTVDLSTVNQSINQLSDDLKSNNLNKINDDVINPSSFQTTPPYQNSPSPTMVYWTEESKKDDKKENEDSEEEILRKLKEKLNHS